MKINVMIYQDDADELFCNGCENIDMMIATRTQPEEFNCPGEFEPFSWECPKRKMNIESLLESIENDVIGIEIISRRSKNERI